MQLLLLVCHQHAHRLEVLGVIPIQNLHEGFLLNR
jgi:hypothetical protein